MFVKRKFFILLRPRRGSLQNTLKFGVLNQDHSLYFCFALFEYFNCGKCKQLVLFTLEQFSTEFLVDLRIRIGIIGKTFVSCLKRL